MPPFVPWPVSYKPLGGDLRLPTTLRIAGPGALRATAELLAGELREGRGLKAVATDVDGTVALQIDPKLDAQTYRLKVDRKVEIVGGSRLAVVWGTATFLQAVGNGRVARMSVMDRPAREYRGLMVDVARRPHPVASLRPLIDLARLYKLRYVHLHLSDDQSFTFPSKAFPRLGAEGFRYSAEELRELVRYADVRGVALVPEIEMPGHNSALVRSMPELFAIEGTDLGGTMNFAREEAARAMETLLEEAAAIFTTSPYLHLGGDEVDLRGAEKNPAFAALGRPPAAAFRLFVAWMARKSLALGRRPIVWDGFGRDLDPALAIPKETVIMQFSSEVYPPSEVAKDGFQTINAAWNPLYAVNRHRWPPAKAYAWDLDRFGRYGTVWPAIEWMTAPKASVIGAQACAWEQPAWLELESLRGIVPAMAERSWGGPSRRDFLPRLSATDALLGRLTQPVVGTFGGLAPVGDGFASAQFYETATLRLNPRAAGDAVRYTLDGSEPGEGSPLYREPIVLKGTTDVRAVAFGPQGRRKGEWGTTAWRIPAPVRSLTTGRPVRASGGTQGGQAPALAVDGNRELGSSWWAAPAPQWLEVDLGKVHSIRRLEALTYWDGRRSYRYVIELSTDGKTWTKAVDRSANAEPATERGDEFTIEPTPARYVRLTMLGNTANEGVHVVELNAWE